MQDQVSTAPRAKRNGAGTVRFVPQRRSHGSWFLAALIVAIMASGGLAWWLAPTTEVVRYATAPVSRGDVTRAVTATGTVNPELTIIVGSYVSGVIQQLSCDYNTTVKAGQICAKIDPRPYQATFDQYTAQLQRDRATLEKDRVDLARYQKLVSQDSIARQQADDQYFVVQQDDATVKLDQALVAGAKLNLEYTDIVSPVDGTVVSRNVTQGQTVASSFQTPTLFLIASDLKKMEVDTNVSESDVGGMKEGDKATFTVDAYRNRVFEGSVGQIRQSPQTVQNVVTYDVVVNVDNSDLALMPGMTASTQIVVEQKNDVLRVPDAALRYIPGGLAGVVAGTSGNERGRVWVLREGRPVALSVVPGLDDGNVTEVIEGEIRAGDAVITAETRGRSGTSSNLPPPRL